MSNWKVTISNATCTGAAGLISVQGEVFGEALLKQENVSIIELGIQGTMDTLLKKKLSYKKNSHKRL